MHLCWKFYFFAEKVGTISQLEQSETKQQKYIDEPADIAVQCACISKQIWVVYICSSFLLLALESGDLSQAEKRMNVI